MTTVLLLTAGMVVGAGSLFSESSIEPAASAPSLPVTEPTSPTVGGTDGEVNAGFAACSPDYANGPGADLDKRNMIGAENSVVVSPAEMRAMGMPESTIRTQTESWNKLSPQEQQEQLCRAAQQGAINR
jgi:hypothetical protein